MEYMILIHHDESAWAPTPGSPEFEQMMTAFLAFNQRLIDGGHWVAGANLAPTASATTVRMSAGQPPAVVDGPFAETKEQLAGFYLVKAADLDEVLALAKAVPLPTGSVEVRPVGYRADAD